MTTEGGQSNLPIDSQVAVLWALRKEDIQRSERLERRLTEVHTLLAKQIADLAAKIDGHQCYERPRINRDVAAAGVGGGGLALAVMTILGKVTGWW